MSQSGGRLAWGAMSHAARVLGNLVCVLLLTPLLVRALGVEGFGAWAVAMTTLGWLQFLELGATTWITKVAAEGRQARDGRERSLTRALRSRLALRAVLVAPVGWLVAPALARACAGDDSAPLALALRLVVLANVALLPLLLDPARLQGRGQHGAFNLIALAGRALQLLLTWAALRWAPGLVGATAATLLGLLLTAAAHTAAAWWLAPPAGAEAPAGLAAVAGQARAFGAINLAVLISTQSGVLLAGFLLGPAAAGLYRLADRVTHHLAVFLKQLSAVIGPEVAARLACGDAHELRGLFVAGCRWTLLLGIPPLLVLASWGDWLLTAWVGPAGGAAGPLAAALWAALLLALVQGQAVTLLVYGGEHERVARAFLVTAALDVAASAALASQLGVWGLVVGTLCTVSLVDVLWFLPVGCRRAGLTLAGLLRAALGGSGAPLVALGGGLALGRACWPAPALVPGLGLVAGWSLVCGALWLATGLAAGERRLLRGAATRLASRLRLLPSPGRDSQPESARLGASGR